VVRGKSRWFRGAVVFAFCGGFHVVFVGVGVGGGGLWRQF